MNALHFNANQAGLNTVNCVMRKSPRAVPQVVHVDKLKLYLQPGLGESLAH